MKVVFSSEEAVFTLEFLCYRNYWLKDDITHTRNSITSSKCCIQQIQACFEITYFSRLLAHRSCTTESCATEYNCIDELIRMQIFACIAILFKT